MYIVCIILVSLSVLKLSSGNPSKWGDFRSNNEVPEAKKNKEHRLCDVEESAKILKEHRLCDVEESAKILKEHRLCDVEESAKILKEQIKIVQQDVKTIKETIKIVGVLFDEVETPWVD